MAKILIVGCGAIGRELAITLANAGHDVTGLKRHIPGETHQPFKYFQADIASADDLKALDNNFEHVFFIVSPGSRDEKSYIDLYRTGLDNLLEKFSKAKTPFIFVSSTSVYGQNQGEWVDEESPTLPKNVTSLQIANAEQKLFALNAGHVVVRFSGIYGPGREQLLRMAKQSPEIQKNPPYYTNRIHQTDCVGILAFLLNCRLKGISLEKCYLASDNDPAPLWEVVGWLAEKMHCPAPIDKTVINTADMNKRCRNERLKQLGYRFAYSDYKAGYGEIVSSKIEQN